MDSGTAVMPPPLSNTFSITDPFVDPITHLAVESASPIAQTSFPDAKVDDSNDRPIEPTNVGAAAVHEATPGITGAINAGSIVADIPASGATSGSRPASIGVAMAKFRVPRLRVSQEARQWLTGDLGLIHQRVSQLCLEKARGMHLPIDNIQASVKRSWEGEFSEVVLQLYVRGNLAQSLALWDAIGDSIQRWGAKQSLKSRRLLDEQYAVYVEPVGGR